MEARILTINLAGVSDGWFEGRRDTLVTGIRALAPDVVLGQEVASRGSPYPYDQVEDLLGRIELHYSCFSPYGNPAEIASRERGGLALLSRWPLRRVETLQLPAGATSPDARVATMAVLQPPDGFLHVVGLHLSWPPEQTTVRAAQVRHVLGRIHDLGWDRDRVPLVLGGDLNAEEREPAIALLAARYTDAFRHHHPDAPGTTWAHANPLVWHTAPDRRLDYLFCDEQAMVRDARLTFDDPRAPASDHYGVFTVLGWETP